MSSITRPQHLGMHHLALFIENFEKTVDFYVNLIGMDIEWQPDADNIYLCSGSDNLALHRAPADFDASKSQKLDHLGFIVESPEVLAQWYEYLVANGVTEIGKPKAHRDGAHSFYCKDPDGNSVQIIYHPPLVDNR